MKHIQEDIKKQEFRPVYLFYGEEPYLKQQYREKLQAALLPTEDTMNFSRFAGRGVSIREIIDLGETLPFFAPRRVILLEDTGFFKNKCEELADYLKEMPEHLCMIFSESEVDKRSRMYKAVQKAGRVCECKRQEEKALMRWVLSILGKEKKKITQRDMELFLTKTGNDMGNIRMELQKLLDYTMGREVIAREDIEAVCVTQTSSRIFEMVRAVAEKNQKKALELYGDLLQLREPPMRILYLMARQFYQLLLTKELLAEGHDRQEIAGKLGLHTFVARSYISLAGKYTMEALREAVRDFADGEEQVKTGRLGDTLSVELLIVKYSSC